MPRVVTATAHIGRMRGGAQSHLLRCSDGKDYVVKFRNNPQGPRVLANEFIFSNLASALGRTVPAYRIVEIDERFLQENRQVSFWLPGNRFVACEPGLHFGSEYVVSPLQGKIADQMATSIAAIKNSQEFAAMLVLDKWVCNHDSRQAVVWKRSRERKFTVSFIDHGWCFGGADWSLSDSWIQGIYQRAEVYWSIVGWQSFEPFLSQLESLSPDIIWDAVENTPPGWYLNDWSSLERLAEALIRRRRLVRNLIEDFRVSVRNPFPKWGDSQAA